MLLFGIGGPEFQGFDLGRRAFSGLLAGLLCVIPKMNGCSATDTTQSAAVAPSIAATAPPHSSKTPVPAGKAALLANPSSLNYSWKNVKIVGGGYVTGLYFHPKLQNLMYARTDIGGAYRWGPGDSQWVPLLDSTPKSRWWQMGVEAIGLDPTNPDKLYIAVGEYTNNWDGNGAMLISSDQGNTFTNVALPFKNGSNEQGRETGDRIAVDPNMPSVVYFGTRVAGLQFSTNSGLTWTQAAGLPVVATANGNGVVAVLPVESSGSSGSASPVVYAIAAGTSQGADPQAIYVTIDGPAPNAKWTAVAGQPSFAAKPLAPLQARLGPNRDLYILYGDQPGPNIMTRSELWKFVPSSNWTDGTWTRIALPNQDFSINRSNGYAGIAVDPNHAGHLLVSTLDQYGPTGDVVYRSSDDGLTWRDVSSTKTSPESASPSLATHDASLSPWVAFGRSIDNVSTGNWATALAIDPFNPDHAIYGSGQTVWTTSNLTSADPSSNSMGIVHWTVGGNGIEESEVLGLWAPPTGKTLLLSSIGDVYGFAHQDLTVSPPQQMFSNPAVTPSSIDFEQNNPATVVRVIDGSDGTTPVGSISTDGGLVWHAFSSMPPATKGGGAIAIAPNGSSIVWATEDTPSVWYSTNLGETWAPSAGVSSQAQVVSDRVHAGVFYSLSNGTLSLSIDGGATFTAIQSGLPGSGILSALPDAQGDLWFAGQDAGLFSNSGTASLPTLTGISGVQNAYHLSFGKHSPGSAKPALYLDGQIAGVWGLYRSTDSGATWVQINDSAHQWGGFNAVCGDMRTFGTVYLGTAGGRGIIWATSGN